MDKGPFDMELSQLNSLIGKMGEMVENAIADSIKDLEKRDISNAEIVVKNDRMIDQAELAINEKCLRILALYQPVASDLRFVTTAMLIVTDLERIGDFAIDIAERIIEMNHKHIIMPLPDLPKLVETVKSMVNLSFLAFLKRDSAKAKKVFQLEQIANNLKDAMCEYLQKEMAKNPKNVNSGLPLIHITRHLERIAAHATNISEDVVYMVDAIVIKHKRTTV